MQWKCGLKTFIIGCLLCLFVGTSVARQWEPGPPPPIAPFGNHPLPDEHVVEPMIFPVLAPTQWTDDYGTQRDGFLHTAIDIRAAKMSPIVAPFDGVIGFKVQTFWIYGDDGWAVLGTHLNDDNVGTHDKSGPPDVMFAPDLVSGQRVYAGQFIGYVGMSGDATGPHLHFELFKPGQERSEIRIRDPYPSLKAAKIITAPSIRPGGIRTGHGEMRFDGCVRKVDQVHGFVTLILTAKESENGSLTAVYGPRYIRLKLYDSVASTGGGWFSLNTISRTTVVSCYVAASPKSDDAVVLRLAVPPTRPNLPSNPSFGTPRFGGPPLAQPAPPVVEKKPFIPANVLIALAHDYGDREDTKLAPQLKGMGLTPTVSLEATSKVDLAKYDVVIACHPTNGNFPYDKEETGQLKDFVTKDGGGLFLLGSFGEYESHLSKMGSFSLNKLAAQFNLTFTQYGNANASQPWGGGTTSTMPPRWVMPLGNFAPASRDSITIASGTPAFVVNRFGPILVGFDVGAGRVLALATSADQFTDLIDRNPMYKNMVNEALQWLAEKRPAHVRDGTVARILPQTEITRGRFVFHCSSLFIDQEARGYADAFQKIYDAEVHELGTDLPESLPKLDVILTQGPGAFIQGSEMRKGTSEDLDQFMIGTAAELGRQWEAPCTFPGGFHEAWRGYCAYLAGIKLAKDTGNSRLEKACTAIAQFDWLARTDPTLTRINPLMTDHDAVMKAFHMFASLQKTYGDRIWARFLAAYRPYANTHSGICELADFIDLMSQATGRDLRPWFKQCGASR